MSLFLEKTPGIERYPVPRKRVPAFRVLAVIQHISFTQPEQSTSVPIAGMPADTLPASPRPKTRNIPERGAPAYAGPVDRNHFQIFFPCVTHDYI